MPLVLMNTITCGNMQDGCVMRARHMICRVPQAEAALSGLEDDVRCYNLLADRLALVPLSAKRSGGIAYEIAVDRAAPAGRLINVDLKVGVRVACRAEQMLLYCWAKMQ